MSDPIKETAHSIKAKPAGGPGVRQGTVTGTNPLTITLGKSSTEIPDVKRLDTNWVPQANDEVFVLRDGAGITIVLGPVI